MTGVTGRRGRFRARVCRPGELGAGEIAAWRRFQAADPALDNPFLSPELAVAVDTVRPDTRVAVVEADGVLAGFLAFAAGRLGVAGPVAPGMCDLQAFVADPETAWDPRSVVDAAGLRAWRFDHLVGGQAGSAEVGAESWVIDLPDGWEGYREWAKAERGRYLNWLERKQRRFEREHPDHAFSYGADDPDGLAALMALKSAQCVRMGWDDFLQRPWAAALVERLASTRSPGLTGSLSALRAGGRVVAVDFSLRSATTYAGWLIAYDDQLASSSPGAVRWRYVLEAAAGDGIVRVDLGKGVDDFKRRFSTRTVPLAEGMWAATGTQAAALARADVLVRRLRSRHGAAEERARQAVRSARRLRARVPSRRTADH